MRLGKPKVLTDLQSIPEELRSELAGISDQVSRTAAMGLLAFGLIAAVAVTALLVAISKGTSS
jgi:hypothetical protein